MEDPLLKPSEQPAVRKSFLFVVGSAAIGVCVLAAALGASNLVGDINGDGKVDITDLSIMLTDWGTNNASADLNHDGTVNVFDLSLLLDHWGQTAPTATPTPSPTPSPSPVAGFPDSTNTGYKHAPDYPGSLHSCGSSVSSNTTYNFCDFPGGLSVGSSSNHVSNVTFHGCRFHGAAVLGGLVVVFGDNLTFDYSSFEPAVAAPPVPFNQSYQYGIAANGSYYSFAQKMTVTHSDFWGFGNAIDTQGSTQAKPQVFRDNYVHDAAADGGGQYHTDGIGDESGSGNGSYVVLDHNTIVSAGNTNGIAFQAGSYSNFSITNNLISGWGYSVALWAPAPNTTFTGNTFSTLLKPVWGSLYPQSFWTSSGSYWHNNKWVVPAGAAYGNAADNGKFWTPNGPSATDYQ
jgi:hypothetical protein